VRTLLSNGTAWQLILLVFVQVVFVTMVYGPIRGLPVGAVPGEDSHTPLCRCLSHRNGVVRGLLPVIGLASSPDREHLRRPLLPDRRCAATFVIGSLLLTETHSV
jgi:hypothetical protein